jgi:hypothetical protein
VRRRHIFVDFFKSHRDVQREVMISEKKCFQEFCVVAFFASAIPYGGRRSRTFCSEPQAFRQAEKQTKMNEK